MDGPVTAPDREERIMREAQNLRDSQLETLRVEADRITELARIAERVSAARRRWWGCVLAGLAVLLIVGAGIGSVAYNVTKDDARKAAERARHEQVVQEDKAREAHVAETCIREGNIWYDGNCLLTRKAG